MASPPRKLNHAPNSGTDQPSSAAAAKIAHELANLIDGSLRNVGMVMSTLRQQPTESVESTGDDVVRRLESAKDAMGQMAALIRRWMDSIHRAQPLDHDNRSLADAVDHAVRLLAVAAEERGIHMRVAIDPQAAHLPAASVYPVIANAIRNSIEAIDSIPAGSPQRGKRIDVNAHLHEGQVRLSIEDDGPGVSDQVLNSDGRLTLGKTTKPAGHGLGLQLCQEIAHSLGGELTLTNRSPHGAAFQLRYPVPTR
ncbi:MAG: HAMP domain-containing histidine kinase [Phycisphaeraceae bacterium]|nr:HAMP domain-containing histidine kinase [Phycisphaeraceae bacterium]